MITPSRRRTRAKPRGREFELHEAAARRLAAHERGRRAALGALVAAVLVALGGLAWPVPLVAHVGAVAAGALLGLVAPLPSQRPRALAHIGQTTGLAYETALEVLGRRRAGAPGAADEFGLEASLLAQAQRSVVGYRPEQLAAWWLPLLVLTVAVVVLAQLLPRPALSRPPLAWPPSSPGSSSAPLAQPPSAPLRRAPPRHPRAARRPALRSRRAAQTPATTPSPATSRP